ncbi:hypothetical protein [Luteolibacter luteus]|uniref:Uncharacterized protein n=1 Tax=Luteolibacter luteus TaxID=2728835 RepID=A0A858RNR2_9BACT|nr:hypothetical protein [Luteolibacter luteus]QJE98241.1 hypothetical protein HHL09_21460 [Luteolibacter luteus]
MLLFRHRGAAAWMGLCGAIVGAMATILAIASPWIGNIFRHPASDDWMLLYHGLNTIAGFGNLTFLVGLVLHLLRKTAETQRIEQLETIIRDRDQA